MKLSEWAKQNNINYITAWRRWKNDKLPEGITAKQTASGAILVEMSKTKKVKNDITNAIKNLYPEESRDIIDDFEIKDLIRKLESKIEQKMRGDEIQSIKEDINDLKELMSSVIYTLEKNSIEKEEIEEVFVGKEMTELEKQHMNKKEELSSKLIEGKLGFVRSKTKKQKLPAKEDLIAKLEAALLKP